MNKFDQACQLFDEYNSRDPKLTFINDNKVTESLLYAQRMTEKLLDFKANASEPLRLAARSQHIGRWEIPRSEYPMDRNGYLQWRSQLKLHHAKLAAAILEKCGFDELAITKVKELLLKKNLKQNSDSQTLEDVICLVFMEFYFDDFSKEHQEEKLVNILKKTIAKMSSKGIKAILELSLSDKAKALIEKARIQK